MGGRHWELVQGDEGSARDCESDGVHGNLPMNPSYGVVVLGGATSSVMPQTTEDLPKRIKAEEGAVDIEPAQTNANAVCTLDQRVPRLYLALSSVIGID